MILPGFWQKNGIATGDNNQRNGHKAISVPVPHRCLCQKRLALGDSRAR